jgi:23S rRNA pseudouridine1911/1915/1917 synthase
MEETHGERHEIAAGPEDSGKRLDVVLASRVPGLSRTRARDLIREGRVASGRATLSEPDYRVKPGQSFAIIVPEAEPAIPRAQSIPLAILHEDEHLIVIDKPAGLVVHPAPGNRDGTLVNALLAHCGDSLAGVGGVKRPGIVHRLDKDTSGVLVVAKTDAAYAGLQSQFARRSVERSYVAVAWGVPSPRTGEISGAIGRDRRNRKKMAVVAKGGRTALTRYAVERILGGGAASIVRCRLATGRTHQIRVHLASLGHPIMGDPVYAAGRRRNAPEKAKEAAKAIGRQALHAEHLGFIHPVTGRNLCFESKIPKEIRKIIDKLEKL